MARKRTRGILALAGAALAAVLSACGRGSQGRYGTIEDPEVIRRIVACINGIELEEDAPFLQ